VHVFRVAQHHMREGQMLTQTQEEMLLIGGFGLFWLGTSGPVPVPYSSAFLSSPSLFLLDYQLGCTFLPVRSDPRRVVLNQINFVLTHARRVIKCVLISRETHTHPLLSKSPSPSYPLTCGPVIVKTTVTNLGGIGRSVQTSDPYFQLC
jgi:hypothetical protein